MTTPARSLSRARSIGFGTFLLALSLLPLYPKISLVSIAGTYIPIRLDDVITVGALVVWSSSLLAERRGPRIPPLARPAIAWLIAGLLSLLVGAGLQHTISWNPGALYWAKPIEYLLLGWMAFDLVTTRQRLVAMLAVILASAAIVVAYGLLQRLGLAPTPASYVPGSTQGVLTSTFADPHELGVYLGLIAMIVVALWHRASNRGRLAGGVFLVALAYVLVYTGVRSEYIALLVVAVAFLWWRQTRFPSAVLLASLLTLFVLPAGAQNCIVSTISGPEIVTPASSARTDSSSPDNAQPSAAGPCATLPPLPGSTNVGDRIGGDLSQDVSLSIRFQDKWPRLLRITWAHPFLGGGPSAATEAADGYYIRSLVEVGLIGTVAFLGLLVAVVVRLSFGFRRGSGLPRWLAFAALSGTLFVAAVGVLIDTWVASRPMQLYWPLVGAALSGLELSRTPTIVAPQAGPEESSRAELSGASSAIPL